MGPRPHLFLCMQNNVISIRITSLYWSQPSSVVFACKTASFESELHFSMSPGLRLLICECKTVCLDPERRLSIGPSLNLWFCMFKTAPLASELIFSMGPSPPLWLFYAKQRLYDQNYKSLSVPDLTYVLLHS